MDQIKYHDVLKEVGQFTCAGVNFSVIKDDWKDGRKHLYFVESRNELRAGVDRRGREITRVGYRVFGDEAVLLGIVVPSKYAGKNLGKEIIDYFIQFIEKNGLKFVGTGQINKPMIAQALVRAGFEPVSKNVLVEILPRPSDNVSRVPEVQVLANEQSAKLITGSHGGDFYRVIPPEEVLKKYPITTDESIVAIQTRYVRKTPG